MISVNLRLRRIKLEFSYMYFADLGYYLLIKLDWTVITASANKAAMGMKC